MRKTFTILFLFAISLSLKAQTFDGENLAIIVASDASANNTTFSIVEIKKNLAGQSAINTFAIPSTGGTAMRFSGSASSTGYLSRSNDKTLLVFNGAASSSTTGNVNTVLTRAIGTLGNTYNFNVATTYTGVSGNQTRSATSINNSNWFISDQGGLYTNNSSSVSPSGNFRAAKAFGGIVYLSAASSTTTVIQVGTISATTGATYIGLPGLANNSNLQDYYLVRSGNNGANFDVLYVLSASSATVGTIAKYSLVSGSWVSNGTYTTNFGGFSLAAELAGASLFNLYVTTGNGATSGNGVIKLTDEAGYNSALNINSSNNLTLYITPSGTTIKGVEFAPVDPITLPIKLTSFAGKSLIGNNLKFDWATSDEKNFSHFELEESTDGKTFNKLAIVPSKKIASGSKYELTVNSTVNYFRLKSVDFDGSYNYSAVVFIKKNGEFLNVFPNPATDKITIQVKDSGKKLVSIYSSSGQLVYSKSFQGEQHVVTTSAFPKGIYYIKTILENGVKTFAKTVVFK